MKIKSDHYKKRLIFAAVFICPYHPSRQMPAAMDLCDAVCCGRGNITIFPSVHNTWIG